MNIKKILFVFSILLFATSILFYDVLYSDSIFLTQDSISAKSIKHGIEKSTVDFGEYPKWMPWIFGGLPSTHSMQNISEYYYQVKAYVASISRAKEILINYPRTTSVKPALEIMYYSFFMLSST